MASDAEKPASEHIQTEDEIHVLDLLAALGSEKALIIGVPLIAAIVAAIVSFFLPVAFTASTSFLPPQQQQSTAAALLQQFGGLANVAGGIVGVRRPEELYIGILRSASIQDALIDRFDLMKRYDVQYRLFAREQLTKNVDIRIDRTGMLRLDATDRDAIFAATLANAHLDELRKFLGSLAVTEAQQRRAFFEQQLLNAKETLVKAEIALKQTQERTGVIALDKQGEAIIRASADLRAQIASREVQLQAMQNFATPENADMQRIASEIRGLRTQLSKLESGQVRGQGDIIVPTGKVPEVGLEYIRALREVKYHEAIFEAMARQFELAKADEAREGPLLQQIDVAKAPEFRSKPKRRQIVTTVFFVTAILSLVIALVRVTARKALADPVRMARLRMAWSSWRIGRRK